MGVELAAELAGMDSDELNVTLVHTSEACLGPQDPPELRAQVDAGLAKLGVRLLLKHRVLTIGGSSSGWDGVTPGPVDVATDTGAVVCGADLVFVCTGVKRQSGAVAAMLSAFPGSLDEQGRVRVQRTFQLLGHEHIFALGDACDAEDRAWNATKHAEVVAANVACVHSAKQAATAPPTPAASNGRFGPAPGRATTHSLQKYSRSDTPLSLRLGTIGLIH